MMEMAMADGAIGAEEAKMLARKRQEWGISDGQHAVLLAALVSIAAASIGSGAGAVAGAGAGAAAAAAAGEGGARAGNKRKEGQPAAAEPAQKRQK